MTNNEVKNRLALGAISRANNEFSTYFEKNFNVDGSPTHVNLESIFNAPQDHINDIIGYSKYCYRKYGIIMRVINIIRDFGASEYEIQYKNKNEKIKNCIQEYNERIKLDNLLRDMIYELAMTGNLVCYDRDGKSVDIYPINMIEVVPLTKNGKQVLGFKTNEIQPMFNIYNKQINDLIESAYPDEVMEGIRKGSDIYTILNPDLSYFVKINSSRYERYGIPVILPAFEDLSHKNLLKEAEKATAVSIIDKLMCIQIGDADNTPNDEMIDKYSELFDSMTGSVRATVPYYVNISWVEPQTDVFGEDKFIQVDTDILSTLGISLSLIRGEGGGNYAEGMISFTGLTRTIETLQDAVAEIINGMYQQELVRNGFNIKHSPTIKFKDVVIDKSSKITLLKELFTNVGLPYEVFYKECGYDYDYIKLVRQNENKEKAEEIFKLRAQPFQGQGWGNNNNNNQNNEKSPVDPNRKSDKNQSNNNQPRTGTTGRSE